jgi:hypothetical protein
VDVAPQTADTIEIFAAVYIKQGATVGPFDQKRLVFGHLCERMPHVFPIPLP